MIDELDSSSEEGMALSDLVSRVLDRGVTLRGDVVISVAGVDLIRLGLRLDLWAVETERRWSERVRTAEAKPLPRPEGG